MPKKDNDTIYITVQVYGQTKKIKLNNFKDGEELNDSLNQLLRIVSTSIVSAASFIATDYSEGGAEASKDYDFEKLSLAVANKFHKDCTEVIASGFASAKAELNKEEGGDA
jgi:hypothetical protein